MTSGQVFTKRIYDPPEANDGQRILVDRIWPRGVKRDAAHLSAWLKELAPSAALRKWFDHDPARFELFRKRYWEELERNSADIRTVRDLVGRGKVTLLYAAKDETHNNAVVLAEYLSHHPAN